MARLPRRHIPLEVKCRVALAQLGEMWPDDVIARWRPRGPAARSVPSGEPLGPRGLGRLLEGLLARLAVLLGCDVSQLRLDHNPALGARQKRQDRAGAIIGYIPDEHDPAFLIYRTVHGHHIKTNIRGDGAQHPDRVLIKRQKRHERGPRKPKRKARFTSSINKSTPKMKSRSFQQLRCAIGARCFCNAQRRKRCGNYRKAGM